MVDRPRSRTDSIDKTAVFDLVDGDVVVVHAGGFRVDAQEIVATVQAARVVGVIESACHLNTGASAAISSVEALAKRQNTGRKKLRGSTGARV